MFGYDFENESQVERVVIGIFVLDRVAEVENRVDLGQMLTMENFYDYDDDDDDLIVTIRCHEYVDGLSVVHDAIYCAPVGYSVGLTTTIDWIYWLKLLNCVHNLFRVANAPTRNHQLVYIREHMPKNCHNNIYPMGIRTYPFGMIQNNVRDSVVYHSHRIYLNLLMADKIVHPSSVDTLVFSIDFHAFWSMLWFHQLSMNWQIATLHHPYN